MEISQDYRLLVLLAATKSNRNRLVGESEQIAARLLERLESPNESATVLQSRRTRGPREGSGHVPEVGGGEVRDSTD